MVGIFKRRDDGQLSPMVESVVWTVDVDELRGKLELATNIPQGCSPAEIGKLSREAFFLFLRFERPRGSGDGESRLRIKGVQQVELQSREDYDKVQADGWKIFAPMPASEVQGMALILYRIDAVA